MKHPVTVPTAARKSGVNPSSIYRWIDEGRIEAMTDDQHGYLLIGFGDIEKIRDQQRAKGAIPDPREPGRSRTKPGPEKGRKSPRGGAYGSDWMSIPQAAEVLGMAASTLYSHIRKQKFPEDPERDLDYSPTGVRMVKRDQVHRYADYLIAKYEGGPLPVGRQGRPDLEPWSSVIARQKNRSTGGGRAGVRGA